MLEQQAPSGCGAQRAVAGDQHCTGQALQGFKALGDSRLGDRQAAGGAFKAAFLDQRGEAVQQFGSEGGYRADSVKINMSWALRFWRRSCGMCNEY